LEAASLPDAELIPSVLGAGEEAPADERAALRTIVREIETRVRTRAQTGAARRDAHPKAHGCVTAEFRVLDPLPDALRVGIFAEPRSFMARIRFSNGSETPQNDKLADGRGMAVKLLGVERSRSTTQDFIMINNPAFFVRNAADYVDFQNAAPPWRFFLPGWNPFNIRLHELLVARAITKRMLGNPLGGRYWSMTPYLFGAVACKFSAQPAGPPSPFNDTSAPDFLHDNMTRHLAEAGAEFDFMVQLRTRAAAMPIEDPTIEWPEDAAPFVPVARIIIPPQNFDSPEQRACCENLSFTPWHGLEEHRPLGGINRVRRTVYETISRLRHELNGVPRREPAS
jgi:hypothetical protein